MKRVNQNANKNQQRKKNAGGTEDFMIRDGDHIHRKIQKTIPMTRYANYLDVPTHRSVSYYFEDIGQIHDYHKGTFKRARYGRYDNPTWEYAEMLMANLEDCDASLLFPSGMSAITTSTLAICSKGDHIIYNDNCYRNIDRFYREILPRLGIEATGISGLSENFVGEVAGAIKSNTKVIFVEMPSNPHAQLVDLSQLKRVLQSHPNIILMVDSTLATPYNFKASRYGADAVIQSCTKYLSGNANIMAGCISGSRDLIEKVRYFRNVLGGIISPEDAYLLVQGIYTLTPRMEYYNKAGLRIAQYLEKHPKVKRVYYTGLRSHPQFSLAKRLMKGYGGVICFELNASPRAVAKFIDSLIIPYTSTHFGGPFTTIEQYGIFTLYHMDKSEKEKIGVNDQLIRMGIGFENIDLLIKDLEQALSKI